MTDFDKEMQKALLADAQKLRDEGVDVADPVFIDDADELWDNGPPEDEEPACVYCRCTESNACELEDGPCSWIAGDAQVCTNPDCVEKAGAASQAAAAAADVDLANPPITDVEASALVSGHYGDYEIVDGPNSSLPDRILEIPLDDIAPDPEQARDEGADDSIGDTLQPTDILPAIELRVHPFANRLIPNASAKPIAYPPYMIIDGERRWRGSRKAGRATIRAWVNPNPGDDGDRLLRQAVLNEGERLKPMEEARTWARIREKKGWTIQQLAGAVKRPKSTVSDRLAMLEAPAGFQPLFADGTLSAAAAPVVRPYGHLDDAIVAKILERAANHHDWAVAVRQGKTVPLAAVEGGLASALQWPFAEMHQEHIADYAGEKFEVKGTHYAVDKDAYWKHVRDKQAKVQKASGASSGTSNDDWRKRQAADQKRYAEQRERKQKVNAAHVAAVNAKLPGELTAAWLLLLIEEMLLNGASADIAELAGLPKPGKSKSGMFSDNQVLAHAAKLGAEGRTKLLLQIMLSEALPEYGNRRFLESAAKLLKINLKKVKPAAAPVAKKAPAKKPSTKKAR